MTRQEIFDTVARHLLGQGRPAMDAYGYCMYRGEDGTKCAVGALIPDELYRPAMEHVGAADLLTGNEALRALIGMENVGLVDALQAIHDEHAGSAYFKQDVLEDLADLAQAEELDDAVLKT